MTTDPIEPAGPSRLARLLPVLTVLLLLAVALAWLSHPRVRLDDLVGQTMGTTYSVKVVTEGRRLGPRDRDALAADVHACLHDVNQRMSTYLADSELSRFNRHADGSPFAMSEPTFHVFQRAVQISALSGGAFDITVGPIVDAYGFGPQSRPVSPPDDAALAALKERVGYPLLELNPANRTVRKHRPDVACDLGAIAKGYGVDRVADVLERRGIARYMVEVGGEVRVRGRNAEGRPWRIAVEKPVDTGRELHRVLHLTAGAVATSGDYRNYYLADGQRICHEIDPRTGRAVRSNLASATVLADDCETADAWATALMVLGPQEGYHLAQQQGLAALFLVRQPNGEFLDKETSAFATARAEHEAEP